MAGNATELPLHAKALRTFLLLSNEEEHKSTFPQPIRRTIHFFLSMVSIIMREQQPFQIWEPAPRTNEFTPTTRYIIGNSHASFHKFASTLLGEQTLLCPALISITADIRLVVLFTESYRAHPNAQPLEAEVESIFFLIRSIDHRLLSLLHISSAPELECICLVLYFSVHCDRKECTSANSALCRSLASQLMNTLKRTHLRDWDQHLSTLAWLVFIGMHMSAKRDERGYFLKRLVTCVENMKLTSKEELRQVFLGFPYLDRVYENSLNGVWGEVQQKRKDVQIE
jgi:hypothetical protein